MVFDLLTARGRAQIKDPPPEGISFRLGTEKDIPHIRRIAVDLYSHSRYTFDVNFPRDKVREFYSSWIEKAVRGTFDDLAWIICANDIPVGFCSVRYQENCEASIGLVGIDNRFAGKGLGAFVLTRTLEELESEGVKRIRVVTQGRNYAAQRLYQKVGFFIKQIEIYYHRWYNW